MVIFKKQGSPSLTLAEVTEKLNELKIPLALVFTPTNLSEEKKKFLESDTSNPQFKYRIVQNENEAIFKDLASLNEISDVDPRISEFYLELIDSKKQASDLMHAAGNNEKVTKISGKRFGVASPILYRNACRVLKENVSIYNLVNENRVKQTGFLGYDQVEEAFQAVFDAFGLDDWSVAKSINIMKNGAKVGVKRKEVLLDPNIQRSGQQLRKTLVHEVGTHVLRAHNGMLSGFEALSKANVESYQDTEEGLAAYNEEIMGVLRYKNLKKYASYVFALEMAGDLTFRQLYNVLLSHSGRLSAFDIAYRVKRGMGDTSVPGFYSKDIVYFRGFRRVRKKVAEDVTLYDKLYAGKIGFKQVKWVEDGLLPKAKIVPSKEIFDRVFKKLGI